MTEPDVALTDYGLFIECVIFAWLMARQPGEPASLRNWIVVFLSSTALAAFFGGTVHGFFANQTSGASRGLWVLSLLALGTTALAGWAIGAYLLIPARSTWVIRLAALLAVGYASMILLVTDAFWVAIAGYLPAALFLFAGFLRAAVRSHEAWAKAGAWGLALSFAAAVVQQLRIALHPVYFNHNALYHLVQALGLALVFVGCRGLLSSRGRLHADTA
jgi:hypothetical protein